MAVSEDEIIRDQAERDGLSKAIADAESALASSAPGTRRLIANFVEHAKARVVALDKKIEEAKVERAAEAQAQIAAAALAAKETKLNAKERETYRGLLEKDYFTKKDFDKLDEFYTHSYDRLSEGGKEEMSKRIHEGIKRGEFKATDLPESVLKRDAELSRDHAAVGTTEPIGHASGADKQTHAQEGASTAKSGDGAVAKPLHPAPNPEIDLTSIDLKGVKLVATASEPTSALIPDASGRSANGRS